LNLAVGDDDGLIVTRRGAGSIDHAYMGQRDQRCFRPDKLLAVGRSLGQTSDKNAKQQKH
jgi:hypothetical protein